MPRVYGLSPCMLCGREQGPILAFIYAVKELLETSGSGGLGCNVAFVFEGEEENGSGGFRNALRSNLQWCVPHEGPGKGLRSW